MTENQDVVAPALDTTRESSNSTTKADRGVPSFSASVLTHLKRIHASLSPAILDAKSDFRKGIQNDGNEEIGESTEDASQPDPLKSLPSFLAYMASPIAKAHRHAEPLDLSAPISNYYISSSHNTYLTGNQLYGDASITSYTNVGLNLVFRLCVLTFEESRRGLANHTPASNDTTKNYHQEHLSSACKPRAMIVADSVL
jgi:hypothetical protein